jgi:phosphoglycolate phosphatase-like HAD superfamily hydrolase
MLIFFDFDGTLTDMSERWWRLHVDLTKKYKLPTLSKKKYIEQKRNAISERIIMGTVNTDKKNIEKYIQKRTELIEHQKYLAYDKLIPGGKAILREWSKKGTLLLLTRRKSRRNAILQIKKYGISHYFDQILVTGGREKIDLLRQQYKTKLKGSYLITDSGEEVKMGKKFGMKAFAVGYGTRSPAYFAKEGIRDIIRTPHELQKRASYDL